MSGLAPELEKLLVLQEREQRQMRLGKELAAWPNEVKALEQRRAEVRAGAEKKRLVFDLLDETKEKTNLQSAQVGSRVNLESSLRADGKVGGHFVTGHIDGTARVSKWGRSGEDWELEAEVPEGLERYLVPKGCVAIDGISLTIGRVEARKFNVWIIPHTYEVTTLRDRKVGDKVNLECDLLAKYVEKMSGVKS